MELPIVLTIVLTFISPFISAYVQNVTWSAQTKNLLALIVSLVIAVVYLIVSGTIGDWSQLAIVVPMVYTLQQLVYQFLVKNIATKFEAITNFGSLIVTPSAEAGRVDITTDATIKATGDKISVDAPVQISDPPEVLFNETPAKG